MTPAQVAAHLRAIVDATPRDDLARDLADSIERGDVDVELLVRRAGRFGRFRAGIDEGGRLWRELAVSLGERLKYPNGKVTR